VKRQLAATLKQIHTWVHLLELVVVNPKPTTTQQLKDPYLIMISMSSDSMEKHTMQH
jgi:hypothetical protein